MTSFSLHVLLMSEFEDTSLGSVSKLLRTKLNTKLLTTSHILPANYTLSLKQPRIPFQAEYLHDKINILMAGYSLESKCTGKFIIC